MRNVIYLLLIVSPLSFAQEEIVEMDPNLIKMNNYVHAALPKAMLERIKATTDTFEIVDGISFEEAVDLYKRDLDPETNLVIWEEMARVYNQFCTSRCKSAEERMDVYRALLLRSMFDRQAALARFQPNVISRKEASEVMGQYRLDAKPIDVIQ